MTAAQPMTAARIDAESLWRTAVEIDLQATMALARASATALLCLSPLAYREVREALDLEIATLDRAGDASGAAAAQLVRQYISSEPR